MIHATSVVKKVHFWSCSVGPIRHGGFSLLVTIFKQNLWKTKDVPVKRAYLRIMVKPLFLNIARASVYYNYEQSGEKVSVQARNTDAWWLDPKLSAAQIHIPNPNRISCKMYGNLSFLRKQWLSNAKSQTREIHWQNLSR